MNLRQCFVLSVIALLSSLACVSAGEKPVGIKAIKVTARQRIHPVLIRNDRNPLLEVIIETEQKDVFLYCLTFSLQGTDDLDDIESLQVFTPGAKQNYSTQATFGDRAKPSSEVLFRGNVRLNRGVNVLWLSCQLSPTASLNHKVDAICTKVVTSAGVVTPEAATPQAETINVRKRIGVALRRHFDDGVHTYRIPALATTPQGTLLCVYDMRRRAGRDLQEDIDIGLLRSTDGGQTWEPQRVIMDMHEYGNLPQEQNGCSDPGIIVDPTTGEIFVSAVWTWGRPGTHQ